MIPGIWAGFPQSGGGGGGAFRIPITVPAQSANLVGFPVYIGMDGLGSGFWDNLAYSDGRDIRVKDESGYDIPFDLVFCSGTDAWGTLFVRTDLSSSTSTTFYIHYGDPGVSSFVAVDSANGRYATWDGYHRVFVPAIDMLDRTGNGSGAFLTGATPPNNATCMEVQESNIVPGHQGVCSDGVHYYVTDTNRIDKYDLSWALVASNPNPIASVPGTNHCGDPCIHDGVLYVPVESYTNISTFSNQHIARFNASDLSFISATNVSTQGHECSSIAYCGRDGDLYVSSYADGSKLWRYSTSGSYVGALGLSITISLCQGVTWWRDGFYTSEESGSAIRRVEYDGSVGSEITRTGGTGEGIGHLPDSLLVTRVHASGSDLVVSQVAPRKRGILFNGVSTGRFNADGLTQYTSSAMFATVRAGGTGTGRSVLSYIITGSTADSNRWTLAYRSTDRWGIWNSTDTWLTNGSAPGTSSAFALCAYQDGTTQRDLFIDGISVGLDVGIAARPAAGSLSLVIGAARTGGIEPFLGDIGLDIALYPAKPEAGWCESWGANRKSPETFYAVGAPEVL